uniref:Uncharacterized protein n=1 Tax=Saccoglossus kowalevskii TaxID=10224 RepID=A0ABM0LVR3_SACKO|nr:PREDICTED: putative uncharacterized protein DDB_G0286751-like [Saccoglossus kowalevskii]
MVDYAIAGSKLIEEFLYFKVHNFTYMSDHCQISCLLRLVKNIKLDRISTNTNTLNNLPNSYIWDKLSVFNYQDTLASKAIQDKIKTFLNNNYNEDKDINKAVDDFNSIVTSSANQVFRRKNNKNNNKKFKPRNNKRWFDKECKILKKDVSETAKLLNKFPYDH